MDAILELGLLNGALVAALAVVVAGVTWVCRRPALAHALWLLVLIKLITPPLVPVEIPRPQPLFAEAENVPEISAPVDVPVSSRAAETARFIQPEGVLEEEDLAAATGMIAAEASPVLSGGRQPPEHTVSNRGLTPSASQNRGLTSPARQAQSWQTCVLLCWLAGSCLWWGLAAWRLYRFRRLLRAAAVACPMVQARAEMLARRLGLSYCPRIRLLPAPLPPLLWSLLGPAAIFLPERLWAELTFQQQDTLLAHELAHYQRRDHWVRWLELLALGLYWWHPAAWLARRALHEAEELLCDARVLRALPAAADAYAQALIQTVAFLSGPRLALPGAASGMGHVRPLKARITMMMRGTNADRLPRAGAWALAGLGMTLLVLRPVWADDRTVTATQDQPTAPRQSSAASAPVPTQPASSSVPVNAAQGQPSPTAPVAVNQAAAPTTATVAGPLPNKAQQAEARDQLELLRVQLASKKAELQEARAMARLARQQLKRITQLHNTSGVSEGEFEKAQAEVEIQEARVQGKQAQVREAELRIAQAERRASARRQVGQRVSAGVAPMAPAGGMPSVAGTHVAGQGAGGPVAATPPAPFVQPGMAPPGPANPMSSRSTEQRLERLERNLEKLLKEVQALRNQISEGRRRVPGERGPESSLRRQADPFGGPGETESKAPSPSRP